MKKMIRLVALLAACVATATQADTLQARTHLSHDSDDFDEAVTSLGWLHANGWGLRATSLRYRAPAWSRDGAALALRWEQPDGLSASLGVASVANHQTAVGTLDWQQRIAEHTTLGVSAERDVVDSVRGVDEGLTQTTLALVGDHAFSPRFNVGWAAGATLFSDDNLRPILRTRWNWSIDEALGLNLYLRTRNYRNSDPGQPAYFSPARLGEAALGLSIRLALPVGCVLQAQADAGEQHTDNGSEPVWDAGFGLASPRDSPMAWSLRLATSSASSNSGGGPDYRYAALQAQVVLPF